MTYASFHVHYYSIIIYILQEFSSIKKYGEKFVGLYPQKYSHMKSFAVITLNNQQNIGV